MRLRLGELIFDPDARQLRRGAEEIHLSPKAFDLLKTLIEHRPRALSKSELHEFLWPSTFVSEANLASLIAEIRAALNDTARQPRFVRTAQRYGYAFSGDVVEDGSERVGHAAAARASLCWLLHDGKRIPLAPGENILGREGDGVVVIDSPTVSRRHARILVSPDGASVEDLGSKNGTLLRGVPVSSAAPLANGDEIRVGSIVLRFRVASASTATWTGPD